MNILYVVVHTASVHIVMFLEVPTDVFSGLLFCLVSNCSYYLCPVCFKHACETASSIAECHGFVPGWVKPKTLKLVFAASLLSTQTFRSKSKDLSQNNVSGRVLRFPATVAFVS